MHFEKYVSYIFSHLVNTFCLVHSSFQSNLSSFKCTGSVCKYQFSAFSTYSQMDVELDFDWALLIEKNGFHLSSDSMFRLYL